MSSPLSTLPVELKVEILFSIEDFDSLYSLLQASRPFYDAYAPVRDKLLNSLLERTIHPSLFYDAIKLEEALKSRQRPLKELMDFCLDYKLHVDNPPPIPDELHEVCLQNHHFVTAFTKAYFDQELVRIPACLSVNPSEQLDKEPVPSPAETLRVQRAFYHVWLYSIMLRDPYPRGHLGNVPPESQAFVMDDEATSEDEVQIGPFDNVSDHCWLIAGWQFREMLVIMQFLRDRVYNKCWTFSQREENVRDRFYFYRLGVNLSCHWVSYVETSGLKNLHDILLSNDEELANKTLKSMRYHENFLFQTAILADQIRRGGQRFKETVRETYTSRRICRNPMDLKSFYWSVQDFMLDERYYNNFVVLGACVFDDERLKRWGFHMPEGYNIGADFLRITDAAF